MDIPLLKQQLQAKDAREAELLHQVEELKSVNLYLKTEVKRLIHERRQERELLSGWGMQGSGWESGLGLGAEASFERLRLEGQAACERAAHREELQKLQLQADQQLNEQMATLTKRAATLVAGVLPAIGAAGPTGSADSSNSSSSSSNSSAANGLHTLHVSSSSPEVQQEVEQLIHRYMAGDVGEDAAVSQLSQLHCRMQLLASPNGPGTAPPVVQNGGTCHNPRANSDTRSDHNRRPAPALGAAAAQVKDAQQQGSLSGSSSHLAASAEFAPGIGGFYSQFVLAEPEKLRRLISRASSYSSRGGSMNERSAKGAADLPLAANSNGPAPDPAVDGAEAALAASGDASSSGGSSGITQWGRSWSSRLLSLGSSRFSSSGTQGAEPAAPTTSRSATTNTPAVTLPTDSVSVSAAGAAEKPQAQPPLTSCTSAAATNVNASTSTLSAAAPVFLPATPALSSAPPAPDAPAAAVSNAPDTAAAAAAGGAGGAVEGCKQPAMPTHAPASATSGPKPACAQSPHASTRSSKGKGNKGKGTSAQVQGTMRALRKSLEAAEGVQGEGVGLLDGDPVARQEDDLWGQAAPFGDQEQSLQLYKA